MNIREEVIKTIIAEAEKKEKNKHRQCNQLVNKIKGDIDKLTEMFEDMGIDKESKPYKQLHRMYDIMAGFDPVQKKLAEYFRMPTENAAESMLQSEQDVKIDVDADRDAEEKAVDLSKKYNMDVELKNDDEEQGANF